MRGKKHFSRMLSTLCAVLITSVFVTVPAEAAQFDPAFYGAAYPDVAAAYGTDEQALLNHYLTYGMAEGRFPAADAQPGEAVDAAAGASGSGAASANAEQSASAGEQTAMGAVFQPVPMKKLANYSSLKKRMTDEEFALAYQAALNLVTPYIGLPLEEQIYGITVSIRNLFDNGMGYSMSAPHYNDPYGYFILGTASCAGCTRATGLCLNILGIPYEHVNENQYSHQWCRINVNGTYWISDAYGLYCGPEPAPYAHPWF